MAVAADALATEPACRRLVAREFSSITPENVMKWETVEPAPGQDNVAPADTLVDFARRHRQPVRGHTLVATLFDERLRPKPSYHAVAEVLRTAAHPRR